MLIVIYFQEERKKEKRVTKTYDGHFWRKSFYCCFFSFLQKKINRTHIWYDALHNSNLITFRLSNRKQNNKIFKHHT